MSDALVSSAPAMISVSGHHACGILGGRVRCWGYCNVGQIGQGELEHVGDDEHPSSQGDVQIGGVAVSIEVGDVHSCAVLDTGRVRCWGAGYYGRLGNAQTDNVGDDETPDTQSEALLGTGKVVQIAGGYHHSCALMDTGHVRCWGASGYGTLGYPGFSGNLGDDEAPSTVSSVDVGGAAVQVVAGQYHSCALLANGAVRCWGRNHRGQLGYGHTDSVGDNEPPSAAGDVPLGGSAVQLAAGYYFNCAIMDTGAVRCWGENTHGQLGYGHTNHIGDDETPETQGDIDLGGIAVQIAAGHEHACALLESGAVRCWGRGLYGRLGHGNIDSIGDNESPASAGDIDIGVGDTGDDLGDWVLGISAGHSHTCALMQSGVRCWGRNDWGQLGLGNTEHIGDDELPSSVPNLDLFD